MEVDVNRQTITVNRLVSHQNQTVTIEGDILVPDVKPDVLKIIHTTGNVCVYKKEVQDGKVKWDGCIYLNIIYLANADYEMIRGLTNSLDFSQSIVEDNCKEDMELRNRITIQNMECKVLNERKMNVKVTLNLEFWVYSNEEIPILKDIKNMEGIQTLHSDMSINHLIGTGKCKVSAKDTIHIDEKDNLVEVLKTEIQLRNQERKISYNKILLKADAFVKIMYLTEEGNIKKISQNIPVMGFVDLNNVSENNLLNCYYEIKNIVVKPNISEQHSIMVEIEFEICCDASDCMDIEMIQDMYSPTNEVSFHPKEITAITNKQIKEEICNITERMDIPEIENHSIYDVEVIPIIEQTNVFNGKVVYEGNLKMNFIFSSENITSMNTQAYMLPFTFTMKDEQINSEKVINTRVFSKEEEFMVTADGKIDCNVKLLFELEIYKNTKIQTLDEITVQPKEAKDNPSIIICLVKEGDTLWNIAKKYKTTMDEIIKMNHLENPEVLIVGQKLFIPRFCAQQSEQI